MFLYFHQIKTWQKIVIPLWKSRKNDIFGDKTDIIVDVVYFHQSYSIVLIKKRNHQMKLMKISF